MRNADSVAQALVQQGVDTVFGLIGNGNLELVTSLVDKFGIRYLSARHESGAVAAADGYARAGGRIGIATVTHGPGFTNALTALVTARRAATPLVLIAGNASGYTGRSTQRLDQKRLVEALGIPYFAPGRGEDWTVATRSAVAEARRSGAVVLDLPAELLAHDAPGSPLPETTDADPRAIVDEAQISQIVAAISKAERLLIVSGRGVVLSATGSLVAALADKTGARLGTTMAAKGLLAKHEGDIGLVGGLASARSVSACNQCDTVLALGASLNGFTTEHATLLRQARILRIDANLAAASSVPVDMTICGDLADILSRIVALLPEAGRKPWAVREEAQIERRETRRETWPERVMRELDRLLPEARTISLDHGDQANSAVPHLRSFDPCQWLFMPDFGSLGLSVAAAIGAAAAAPERRTVAIVGDGGMMMSLPDLDFLYRTDLPVLIVVMNDGVFGAEYPHLRRIGASLDPATFSSRSIADIASAVGIPSIKISERGGVGPLAALVGSFGPHLVEVECAPPTSP